jgi:CPA1 family monovalent cation:H+ antiporter
LPQFLHEVATLLVVFAVYAAADLIETESGLLAVTVMGVWLVNMRDVQIDEILDFKESLSILLISGLFIVLAARLDFSQLAAIGWPALFVLLGIQFIARPLKIVVCSIGASLNWRERALLAWVGPRGIVAAAISAVFALRLEQEGVEGAELLVPLSFVVIIGTVVLQSITAGPLARVLGVADPEPEGVLIVGSNPFSRLLGKAIQDAGFRVLISDRSWDSVRHARMDGIETYYGSPISEHAERTMNLAGIGKVFAMSRNAATNHLVCAHFAGEFERANVFALPVSLRDGDESDEKLAPAEVIRARRLFAEDTSLSRLLSEVSRGSSIRKTPLSDEYDFSAWQDDNPDAIPLVAWDDNGHLVALSADAEWTPTDGWTVVALSANGKDGQPAESAKQSQAGPDRLPA